MHLQHSITAKTILAVLYPSFNFQNKKTRSLIKLYNVDGTIHQKNLKICRRKKKLKYRYFIKFLKLLVLFSIFVQRERTHNQVAYSQTSHFLWSRQLLPLEMRLPQASSTDLSKSRQGQSSEHLQNALAGTSIHPAHNQVTRLYII